MGSFSTFMGGLGELVRAPFRPTNLFVLVAVIVVAGSALFIDQQNRALQEQQLRSQVTRQVSVIRARLEGNINGNLQLVRGLVATLVTEPSTNDRLEARIDAASVHPGAGDGARAALLIPAAAARRRS